MAWRYRDTQKPGHFVSESTWNRSRAQGGERYKRESDTKDNPKTADEWDKLYNQYDDFDDPYEIETGVDY